LTFCGIASGAGVGAIGSGITVVGGSSTGAGVGTIGTGSGKTTGAGGGTGSDTGSGADTGAVGAGGAEILSASGSLASSPSTVSSFKNLKISLRTKYPFGCSARKNVCTNLRQGSPWLDISPMTWMMMPPFAEDCASTEWMKTLQSSKPIEVILLWISCDQTSLAHVIPLNQNYHLPHLLTVAWLAVLTLSAMDEGRSFSVKTVQTIWLLIDESIILGNKLPSDLRRNDIVVQSGGVSV
jgi:hypothetical protein